LFPDGQSLFKGEVWICADLAIRPVLLHPIVQWVLTTNASLKLTFWNSHNGLQAAFTSAPLKASGLQWEQRQVLEGARPSAIATFLWCDWSKKPYMPTWVITARAWKEDFNNILIRGAPESIAVQGLHDFFMLVLRTGVCARNAPPIMWPVCVHTIQGYSKHALLSWYMLYSLAHENPSCQILSPLLVVLRRISCKRASNIFDKKHACVLVIIHDWGATKQCGKQLHSSLGHLQCYSCGWVGAGHKRAWGPACVWEQKWTLFFVRLRLWIFIFLFLAPCPLPPPHWDKLRGI
jgi:hypothetical protein